MSAKELLIVGGANGVGKTTFAVEYAAQHNLLYLGADAIAEELAPDAPALVPVAAGQELVRRVNAALEGQDSFVLESTLAGQTLRHTIRNARNAGFSISIMYLFLDSPDCCVQRVNERVQKGGHFVPETDVRRRFSRSIHNFWRLYRPLANHWALIYNSSNQPVDVAAGVADDVSVRDLELYTAFAHLIEGDPDVERT